MTGLVGYGSSGEEEQDDEEQVDEGRRIQLNKPQTPPQPYLLVLGACSPPNDTKNEPTATPAKYETFLHPSQPNGAIPGPPPQRMTPESSASGAPSSPHTIHRAAIRSLTLPTKPNLDIPQSPLGSPIPRADQKFSHFLALKKQGVHFNTKLAASSALKNPSLLPRLMDFAGMGSECQYATTLSTELWDPSRFPKWAYKEELAEAQHGRWKKKKGERVALQRESIDFVAAGTPGQPSELVVSKGTTTSAAERVMAGLAKDREA